MSLGRPPDQDLVVVGATGDLSRRKLIPALYNLERAGLLPARGRIIGYARRSGSDQSFRSLAEESVREFSRSPLEERTFADLAERLCYRSVESGGLESVRAACAQGRQLIYLSIPPSAFEATVGEIEAAGLIEGSSLVIEKPFGRDTASARALSETLSVFDESRVFRIDHYLGKETVQNILVFRFGNVLFERLWNRDSVDHIQITVAESIGIEGRADFYEETGALRDIVQNHVFQVLSLLAMEAPAALSAEAVRNEKAKLFQAMRPLDPADVVRGQYVAGNGHPGYRDEPGVDPASDTETYAALRLWVDNWRWAGVPFFVRTGKRLPERRSLITVVFREAPITLFEGTELTELEPNRINISIQPDEMIRLGFLAKDPGPDISARHAEMHFCHDDASAMEQAEAYERLIHDAMEGDRMLFARSDGVQRAWEVVQPALDSPSPVEFYPAGSWGPPSAGGLIDPRAWELR
ncbi:MAG: glucose-6-phosphate dehydrogenase [Dehalococcoidia bacterium]